MKISKPVYVVIGVVIVIVGLVSVFVLQDRAKEMPIPESRKFVECSKMDGVCWEKSQVYYLHLLSKGYFAKLVIGNMTHGDKEFSHAWTVVLDKKDIWRLYDPHYPEAPQGDPESVRINYVPRLYLADGATYKPEEE